MLRDNDLKPWEGTNCYFEGEAAKQVDLDLVQNLLQQANENKYDLPIKFGRDEVKHGGLLNATKEPCLTIVNREHPEDYFKYCIVLHRVGHKVYFDCTYYGQSVLTGKKHEEEERANRLSGMILNALSRVNEMDYSAEYQYYNEVESMIKEVFVN